MALHRNACILLVFCIVLFRNATGEATFYGNISKGYQSVEKKRGSYTVYVPTTFDSASRPGLIFAFGRSHRDLQLTRKETREYAELWEDEAERRGYVVVVPYWEPVVVGSHQQAEQHFLEILEEVKLIYSIHPQKVLLTGFGLGAVWAVVLADFYPDRFTAVVSIARGPLGDPVMNGLVGSRSLGPLRLPLLIVHGENDGEVPMAWAEEQKVLFEKEGVDVDLKLIPGMAHEHDPQANAVILDWFEKKARSSFNG